jgi:ribosomal protein S18 acetylase RimI-like enzyme
MKDLIIRPAIDEDLDSIINFQLQMAFETEDKKLDRDQTSKGVRAVFADLHKGFYIVAIDKSKVLGSLLVTKEWSDWRAGDFWWVQSVYILPDYRRKGIYNRMYSYIKNLAGKESDVCGLRLYVEHKNIIAQKTYQSLGMLETNYRLYEFEF